VLSWDRHLEHWVVAHRIGVLDPAVKGLTYAGDYGLLWIEIAVVVAVVLRRPPVLLGTALAVVLANGVTSALKLAIPRDRPDVDALVARPHTHSFPSGHAASSIACATVIGAAAPRHRPWLYLLAALVAWSRLYVGAHCPLDVAAGALLGVGVGLLVLRALRMLVSARRRSPRAPRPG
jgi:undecaprenyl-diphosphatase